MHRLPVSKCTRIVAGTSGVDLATTSQPSATVPNKLQAGAVVE